MREIIVLMQCFLQKKRVKSFEKLLNEVVGNGLDRSGIDAVTAILYKIK